MENLGQQHIASDPEEVQLWQQLASGSDTENVQNRLVEDYTPLVKRIAAKLFSRRIDDIAEFGDYFQFGMIGLIESIGRYDSSSSASFKTYASYRITGAILNGLEKTSEYRTQYAHRSRLIKERVESITGQDSTTENLFSDMVNTAVYMALGYMLDDASNEKPKENILQGKNYSSVEMGHIQQQLKYFVEKLPQKESTVIKYHYFHYVNFEEIGEILGVSKGRISQLHKSALQHIRDIFENESSLDILY